MPRTTDPVVEPGTMRDAAQPTLRTDGLVLRPWTAADVPTVVAAFSDPAIQLWHARRIDETEEALAWIVATAEGWTRESDAAWAICAADSQAADETGGGAVLGRVALRGINLVDGFGELAYWVLPDARGRGVAVRAGAEAIRWALDDLGLHRVQLHHSTRNAASCRVAVKLGMRQEGTLRSAMLHRDGWHDLHLHAVLRAANPAARSQFR